MSLNAPPRASDDVTTLNKVDWTQVFNLQRVSRLEFIFTGSESLYLMCLNKNLYWSQTDAEFRPIDQTDRSDRVLFVSESLCFSRKPIGRYGGSNVSIMKPNHQFIDQFVLFTFQPSIDSKTFYVFERDTRMWFFLKRSITKLISL